MFCSPSQCLFGDFFQLNEFDCIQRQSTCHFNRTLFFSRSCEERRINTFRYKFFFFHLHFVSRLCCYYYYCCYCYLWVNDSFQHTVYTFALLCRHYFCLFYFKIMSKCPTLSYLILNSHGLSWMFILFFRYTCWNGDKEAVFHRRKSLRRVCNAFDNRYRQQTVKEQNDCLAVNDFVTVTKLKQIVYIFVHLCKIFA